ncbi:MAG TPA: alanine--glyoxylate aminotransferase family protein [candidate division Zixibacteria bacterium]|nr:alanine--glyoxylate aminotransferase family protein [candidate division Zixibacteria bacterium]
MSHKKLFIPGPTEVLPDILEAMAMPMIGHRSKDYSALQGETTPKVQQCLYTKNQIIVSTSSSTGLMEAAVLNFVRPGKKVLACMCGAFSDRWSKIAKANNKDVIELKVDWGMGIHPEMIDDILAKQAEEIDLVLLVMNETSTGVLNPAKEIQAVVNKYRDAGVMMAIDAVSAMMVVPIKVDEWEVDFVLAGVQKAWSLPPGLAVAAMSERAIERANEVPHRGYYFDLLEYVKSNAKDQTPSTPAISQINALRVMATRILEQEGLENRWARHARQADMVRNWATSRGFEIFPEKGFYSQALTCVKNNLGISVADLNSALGKRGKMISNGYGKLKEETFRISHMGDIYEKDLEELLADIDDILGFK